MEARTDHGVLMDRIYRHQRRFGIYDATRRYYLLGRDPMLAMLAPPPGGTVLEIGCGTGRNLVKAAKLYPHVRFHGIDISREMLVAAGSAVAGIALRERVQLACADAATFDPRAVFGQAGYERVFISYAISMIPQWKLVIEEAASRLSADGELHIADFGDMAGLPRWFRRGMEHWLSMHHVTPRAELFAEVERIAAAMGGTIATRRLHRGYSWVAVLRRSPADGAS